MTVLSFSDRISGTYSSAATAANACVGIDVIDVALGNSFNGANWKASAACDACIANYVSHGFNYLLMLEFYFLCKFSEIFRIGGMLGRFFLLISDNYLYPHLMQKAPLISIITVTYNVSKTLPSTLESIASQTFRDFEHLVIDGASTDDSVAIAQRCGFSIVVSAPDKGIYDAMNKGLRMAKGKYVLFLNAGDSFANDDVLSEYAMKAESMDADIVYSDTDIVNSRREVIGHRHFFVPSQLTLDSFADGMKICHQAFMVRRSLAPNYDMNYRFSADYDWCVRCMQNARLPEKAINLQRVGIHYLSEGVTTRNHRKSLIERFRIMQKHYGLLSTLKHHITKVIHGLG